jgi:hypothetical protein
MTPPNKSPVKHHKWTFDEDKAFVEFISVAKTDPKYGKSYVGEWPAFSEKNSFWSDGAKHIQCSTSPNILLSGKFVRFFIVDVTTVPKKFYKLDMFHT